MNSRAEVPKHVKELIEQKAPGDKKDLEQVWLLADDPSEELAEPEVVDAVSRFEQRLMNSSHRKQRTLFYRLRSTWKIAASFAIIAFSAFYYFIGEQVHEVPFGATAELTLPDGSSVVLNSGSSLSYGRMMWGVERKVKLEGEAFFEVVQGQRSFVVRTTNANIEVLGTAFSIDTWPQGSALTRLRVTEGQVAISSAYDPLQFKTVIANQESEVIGNNSSPSDPESFNAELATLWLNDGIASVDQSVVSLTRRLERKFGVNIHVDRELQDQRLTWIQPKVDRIEDALVDICELIGCQVERVVNGFRLRPLGGERDASQSM